jgi:CheY-like chemotaxis protein
VITILIAEDDTSTAQLLQTLLELESFTTWVAAQPQEACAMIRAHRPDVALIDMHLAHAEGLDVLHATRSDPALNATAVVMTSALDRSEEALAAGADAFLLKPFARAELFGAIQKALANRRARSSIAC